MSEVPLPNLPQPGPSAGGERRELTADELKQIDVMLGHGTGPTLIRPADSPPDRRAAGGALLRAAILAIILGAIVAFAFYLFR
jgi:hypothetical protein